MLAQPLALALALAAAPRPAPPAATPAEAPAPPAIAAYGDAAVDADLEALLYGRGKEYLDARARLEAHPEIVAPRVAARLGAAASTLGPAERQRLLALLGAFSRPEDLEVFAAQLRREAAQAAPGSEGEATEPWRALLRAQGRAAAPILRDLAAERGFTEDLRALLLGDLIAVIAPEELTRFIALVGQGHPTLRAALRQALTRRIRQAPDERARVLPAIDQAIDGAEGAQKAALLGLRGAVQGEPDPAFRGRLIALLDDVAAPFVVRVAALRLLAAEIALAEVEAVVARLAAASLAPEARGGQAAEILGFEALRVLPAATAKALIQRFDLQRAAAPRLAAAAFERGDLAGPWLAAGLAHAWPEVQVAALTRIEPPCAPEIVGLLDEVASPPRKRPDAEPIVIRAALRGLGRCGSPAAEKALIRVLEDERRDPQRRAEAAKQLLLIGSPAGIQAVSGALRGAADPSLARRLVEVVGAGGRSTPALHDGLCLLHDYHQELRAIVAEALRRLDAPACMTERTG